MNIDKFYEELSQFTITKIRNRISEHRVTMRLILKTKQLNLISIVGLIPFFIGFYDFLNQNQQIKKLLFQKNIPSFSLPTKIMNWDTLRYFSLNNKEFFHGIQQVYWSPNSLYFIKKVNQEFTDQKYFISTITNSLKQHFVSNTDKSSFMIDSNNLPLSQKISSNKFVFSSFNKKRLPILQTFYLNLDEIPLKIENFGFDNGFDSTIIEPNSIVSIPKDQDKNNLFDSMFLSFEETFWLNDTKVNSLNLKTNKKVNQTIKIEKIKKLLIDPLIFSKQTQISTKQVAAVNILSNANHLKKTNKINSSKTLGSSLTLKDFWLFNGNWDIILKQLKDEGIFYGRKMSGYEYPDMNSEQVSNFLLQNLFYNLFQKYPLWNLNKTTIQIQFPANSSFIKQYSYTNPETPNFAIHYSQVGIQDLKTKTLLYDKNSIFLSTENGFDWIVENSPENSLYKWLNNYLSPVNPLTHEKVYSKFIDKSPFDLTGTGFQSDPIINQKLYFKVKTEKSPIKQFNSQLEFFVPYLTPQQWINFYNEVLYTDINLSTGEISIFNTNFITIKQNRHIPLIDVRLPYSKDINLIFDINLNVDYLYSAHKLPLNLEIDPSICQWRINSSINQWRINSSVSEAGLNQNLNSISYKKIISSFNKPEEVQYFNELSKNLETSFSDIWEPVTFRSWLIICQIGLAFFFFNFLKSIITEYLTELIWFIVDIGFSIGIIDENLKEEIELLTGQRDKGFRVISETKKRFKDIAGIKPLLPEIAEIVWFLRNSGKEFSISKNFPRGLLLLGPPGTGKTVLVQALAGEAGVPVLALSGSSLIAPGESGALKLEILFQEAREISPCIVFIDEIDTLGQKRTGVLQNPMGGEEVLSALYSTSSEVNTTDFLNTPEISFFKKLHQISGLATKSTDFAQTASKNIAGEIKQQIYAKEKIKQEQLTLLTQLLIELDGIHSRKGVVVIGATNRPEMLDSAVLRPGRFDKIIELGLPGHEKRLEIFKLYGDILGFKPEDNSFSTSKTCWEYFSRRTMGYTPADLASIMNQSSIKAILIDEKNPKHTLKTIEHGIDRIITSEIEKPFKKVTNLFKQKMAYYQAGKIVLSTILEYHPPTLISYLWPRRQNRRSLQILSNLQKYFFQFARRCELEDQIVGSYGGKAAEILFLKNSHTPSSISSFGLEDLSFAFVLICFTIEKWYFYSKTTLISQLSQIISNKNIEKLIPEKTELFNELGSSMEFSPNLFYSHQTDISTHLFSQNLFTNAWWQLHVSKQLEFVETNFADWYRLYLPNLEETEMNIEWSPPDDFYHRNIVNKKINKNTVVTWNDLYKITRDYQVQSFVLQSFNKALSLIDQNREYLDILVFELVKTEVLREPEIEKISSTFISSFKQKTQKTDTQGVSDIKILQNSFGKWSRRKIKNWIDFKEFQKKKK